MTFFPPYAMILVSITEEMQVRYMLFRHSRPEDVPAIAALFDAARISMAALGIDQWQNGVPCADNAAEDVMLGIGRVAEEEGAVVAAYSFLTDGERDYDTIYEGKWLTEHTPYAAVHRVTVAQHLRGSGVSTQMMEQIFAEARAGGFSSVRIDTHEGNIPMRRMLEKHGFVYCGIVYLHGGPDDGAKRVGYEKVWEVQ